MRRIFVSIAIAVAVISISACVKKDTGACTPKSAASEQPAITAYATAKGYTMTALSNGLNYQIINAGTTPKPSATSKVYVRYTGKFISNEQVFDQQQDYTKTGWQLTQLILGWQSGLPLIGKGGSMRLIIPSSLAYGCSAGNGMPANSILYFDIELVDVQ